MKRAIDFHIISIFSITLDKVRGNKINKQTRKKLAVNANEPLRLSLLLIAIKQIEKSMKEKFVISMTSWYNSNLNLLSNHLFFLIIISSVTLSQ